MKAQCHCARGLDRIPNPNCGHCGGSGFCEVRFPDKDDFEAVWLGRCSLCGAQNGTYIQRREGPKPALSSSWRCVNSACEQPTVELIRSKSVVAWHPYCSLCSTLHYAGFLQRSGDDEPTIETHPRTCPNEDCGSSCLIWIRDDLLRAIFGVEV